MFMSGLPVTTAEDEVMAKMATKEMDDLAEAMAEVARFNSPLHMCISQAINLCTDILTIKQSPENLLSNLRAAKDAIREAEFIALEMQRVEDTASNLVR